MRYRLEQPKDRSDLGMDSAFQFLQTNVSKLKHNQSTHDIIDSNPT